MRDIVLALVAQNENQILTQASECIGRGLQRCGYRQHLLNFSDAEANRELLDLLRVGRVAFAYGFAGVGSRFSLADGSNLWTAARVPYAALWYDHPAYNYQQHLVDSPYVLHCYHVRDHIEARHKYLPSTSSTATLLPVPGPIELNVAAPDFGRRAPHILFAKTAMKQDWAEDWKRHPPPVTRILENLAEQGRCDRNLNLADAAKILFAEAGIDSGTNLDLFMGVLQEVDNWVRGWRSDKLVRALLPHPAQIYGRGWDYLAGEQRRADLLPPVSADAYSKLVTESRIIANSNPLWRGGVHERVIGGLAVGGVVLTDRTQRLDQSFASLENYVGFEWGDDLQDVIADTLRRASKDMADYRAASHQALAEQLWAGTDRYVSLLAEAAGKLRV
jgi:hypothetical protein